MRRVVVVTGASAGVGRAVAVAFAKRGCRVGLLARDRAALDEALAEVRVAGGDGIAVPTDVADADAVDRAAERVERELGAIGVWVNNAMATIFARFEDIAPAEFERATQVTYLGLVNGTRAALRSMRRRDFGVILQVGSALAYRAIPLQSPYCGAKFACRGFTDSLRSELLGENSRVRLTMVHLPALNTPQFDWALARLPRRPQPVPPIFAPEVAAEAIVWAADAGRREVWVGWPTVKAILGNKLAPGLLDRFLTGAVEGQQTDEPLRPGRRSNLFRPVHGLHATSGRFSEESRPASLQMWANRHRAPLLLALAAAGTAALLSRRIGRQHVAGAAVPAMTEGATRN